MIIIRVCKVRIVDPRKAIMFGNVPPKKYLAGDKK